MNELGVAIERIIPWFPHETETPYVLVRVSEAHANSWAELVRDAFRRCYLKDQFLETRSHELEKQARGNLNEIQEQIIRSKLPNPGSVMSGDFGEILVYFFQAKEAYPNIAFGPKKWRLKQDRTKSSPYSDVVQFVLPTWPTPSREDVIHCAEVKAKATNGDSTPIQSAIRDCGKDRTSRLAKTLVWLRDRAIGEELGSVRIPHLNRFINATEFPPATKRFRAVAVICSSIAEAELKAAPAIESADFSMVIITVPNLKTVYTSVFEAVQQSNLLAEATE